MNQKEQRAAKAQEMLKHVQESMKQLQNLKKTSLLDISVSKESLQSNSLLPDENDFNSDLLTLNSIKLSSSTPSQLFEASVFACPHIETTPVNNYISIKDTLDSFLYDQQEQDPLNSKDLQLDAMALELKELTSVQEQTLYNLTTDLDTLVLENKFLNERNRSLLSENEKLQKLVENLSCETEQLKHHILSLRTITLSNDSFDTFQANNAGTSASGAIPFLNTGIDVGLCTQNETDESPKRYSDAFTFSPLSVSMVGVSTCPNVKEAHLNGDNFDNITSSVGKFVTSKVVSCGDSAVLQDDKEKKKRKGFLKLFRRHRKGRYNLN